ncbi:MAG: MFS transporter [Dokdonella sp.]
MQCLYWGALYYAFSVTLHPMSETFHVSETSIAGAFSTGLLVMAFAAPSVGRALDRGEGTQLMRWGALLAVATLVASTAITSLIGVYLEWIALGAAMAMVLYEPAFGLVQRAIDDPIERVRALATVTVFGGLASTVCIPLIAWLVAQTGWRSTHAALAATLLVGAAVMEQMVFPSLRERSYVRHAADVPLASSPAPTIPILVRLSFAGSTLAAMALSALLIAALIDRGHSPVAAANALALLGVMQLPGRLWMVSGRSGGSVPVLLAGPLILLALGLLVIACSHGLRGVGIGVAIFGIGAGWSTLARPLVIHALYGSTHAGRLNGSIARLQGFARAAGPLSAAAVYRVFGYSTLFAGLSIVLTVLAAGVLWTHRREKQQLLRSAS